VVVDQYVRCGERFLRCVDEADPKNSIITLLAAITDFCSKYQEPVFVETKTFFTIQGLTEAESIFAHALKH